MAALFPKAGMLFAHSESVSLTVTATNLEKPCVCHACATHLSYARVWPKELSSWFCSQNFKLSSRIAFGCVCQMISRGLNLDSNLKCAAWSASCKGFICSEIHWIKCVEFELFLGLGEISGWGRLVTSSIWLRTLPSPPLMNWPKKKIHTGLLSLKFVFSPCEIQPSIFDKWQVYKSLLPRSIATPSICHTVLLPVPGSCQSLTLLDLLQSLLRKLTLPLFRPTHRRRKRVTLQALVRHQFLWYALHTWSPGTWLRTCILSCTCARSILASSRVTAVSRATRTFPSSSMLSTSLPSRITFFSTNPPWPFSDWPKFLATEQSANLLECMFDCRGAAVDAIRQRAFLDHRKVVQWIFLFRWCRLLSLLFFFPS